MISFYQISWKYRNDNATTLNIWRPYTASSTAAELTVEEAVKAVRELQASPEKEFKVFAATLTEIDPKDLPDDN